MFRFDIVNAAADDDGGGDDAIGLKYVAMEKNKSYCYSNRISFVGLPYIYFTCSNRYSAIKAADELFNGNQVFITMFITTRYMDSVHNYINSVRTLHNIYFIIIYNIIFLIYAQVSFHVFPLKFRIHFSPLPCELQAPSSNPS